MGDSGISAGIAAGARKCWEKGCDQPGTIVDPETPAVFVNEDDPDGPKVRPVHCPEHHRKLMERRDRMEASWQRAFGR